MMRLLLSARREAEFADRACTQAYTERRDGVAARRCVSPGHGRLP